MPGMIDIIALILVALAFGVIYIVYSSGLKRDPMKGRLKDLNERKDQLKAGLITTNKRQSNIKNVDRVNTMRKIANKLKLLQTESTDKISILLAQAGYRSKDALVIYQFSRLITPALGGLIAIFLIYGAGILADDPGMRPLVGIGIVLFFFKLPDILLANIKAKRTDAIRLSLPDALDLMVVCAEAGLTLDATMSRVANELGKAAPEMAEEFTITSIELSFLPNRRMALMNLAERVDLPALGSLITTLVQSERYGTPLAAALRTLSAESRNERMMKAEEKAARLPAILTIPLILFILPCLFIVLLGPAACKVSDTFIKNPIV